MSEQPAVTAPAEPAPAAVTEPTPSGTPTPVVEPGGQPPAEPGAPAPGNQPPAQDPLAAQALAEAKARAERAEQLLQQSMQQQNQPGQQQPPQQQAPLKLIDNFNTHHVKALQDNPIPESIYAGLTQAENPQAFRQSLDAFAAHVASVAATSARNDSLALAQALMAWSGDQHKKFVSQDGVQQHTQAQQQVMQAQEAFFTKYPWLRDPSLHPLMNAEGEAIKKEKGLTGWSPELGDEIAKRMAAKLNPALIQKGQPFNAANGGARPQATPTAGADAKGFSGTTGAIVAKGGF